MSSHVTHRQEGRKHKHHRRLQRGSSLNPVLPSTRAWGSRGVAEALRRAQPPQVGERLQTTRRADVADDEEEPARRGGPEKS